MPPASRIAQPTTSYFEDSGTIETVAKRGLTVCTGQLLQLQPFVWISSASWAFRFQPPQFSWQMLNLYRQVRNATSKIQLLPQKAQQGFRHGPRYEMMVSPSLALRHAAFGSCIRDAVCLDCLPSKLVYQHERFDGKKTCPRLLVRAWLMHMAARHRAEGGTPLRAMLDVETRKFWSDNANQLGEDRYRGARHHLMSKPVL